MNRRPSYRHIQSDFYTHVHDLPPQAPPHTRRGRLPQTTTTPPSHTRVTTTHLGTALAGLPRRSLTLARTAPQIGRCQSVPEAEEFAAEVDGSDGSWSLPLPEDDGSLLQPLQGLGAGADAARSE